MISIIIPAYNAESTIKRTLESVIAQTYTDIEVIVVNDGSTDSTREIVDLYTSQYPQKIVAVHKDNQGVTAARLDGVRRSSGEWIGFVDADDEIEPDMYEFLLENAINYGVDISHCGYQIVFDDGRVNYFYNTGQIVRQDKNTGIKDLLEGAFVEPGLWNKLFRRELLDKLINTGVMDFSIKINEDLLMNYYLFSEASSSLYEDKCKYHYIVHGESATHSSLSMHRIFDPIKVKDIIKKNISENLMPIAGKAYIGTCISMYNTLSLNGLKKYKIEAKIIRGKLLENKELWDYVDNRQRILIWMILHLFGGYEWIYKIYAKILLNNRYE